MVIVVGVFLLSPTLLGAVGVSNAEDMVLGALRRGNDRRRMAMARDEPSSILETLPLDQARVVFAQHREATCLRFHRRVPHMGGIDGDDKVCAIVFLENRERGGVLRVGRCGSVRPSCAFRLVRWIESVLGAGLRNEVR